MATQRSFRRYAVSENNVGLEDGTSLKFKKGVRVDRNDDKALLNAGF